MNKIKLPYGLKGGKLVSINDVERGLACGCECPECKSPLVANKGDKKIHYFSHHSNTNCNGESLLHILGKELFARRVENAIEAGGIITIEWDCTECNSRHEGNLVKAAKRVGLEVVLQGCRPDIVLFDASGKIVALVEIVVKHFPEDAVFKYCDDNKVALLIIDIESIEDVVELETTAKFGLSECSVCLAPKCPECKSAMLERCMFVIETNCWRCRRKMKMAFAQIGSTLLDVDEFCNYDLNVANRHGVILREQYSKTLRERYVANTCGRCGAFIGNHFLIDYRYEAISSVPVNNVLWCEKCNRPFIKST